MVAANKAHDNNPNSRRANVRLIKGLPAERFSWKSFRAERQAVREQQHEKLTEHVERPSQQRTTLSRASGVSCQAWGLSIGLAAPCCLELAARGRPWPDVRLKLVNMIIGEPDAGNMKPQQPKAQQRAVWVPARPVLDTLQATAALLLSYMLLPDVAGPVIQALAKPGLASACAQTLWRHALSKHVANAYQAAEAARDGAATAAMADGLPLLDGLLVVGLVPQVLARAVMDLSGPAAILHYGNVLWTALSPTSHNMAHAMLALMAVLSSSKKLSRDAAMGKIEQGDALEAAWRSHHKQAARRVARFLGDLYEQPPLAPAVDVLQRVSICAAMAVDGHALLPRLPWSEEPPGLVIAASLWHAPSPPSSGQQLPEAPYAAGQRAHPQPATGALAAAAPAPSPAPAVSPGAAAAAAAGAAGTPDAPASQTAAAGAAVPAASDIIQHDASITAIKPGTAPEAEAGAASAGEAAPKLPLIALEPAEAQIAVGAKMLRERLGEGSRQLAAAIEAEAALVAAKEAAPYNSRTPSMQGPIAGMQQEAGPAAALAAPPAAAPPGAAAAAPEAAVQHFTIVVDSETMPTAAQSQQANGPAAHAAGSDEALGGTLDPESVLSRASSLSSAAGGPSFRRSAQPSRNSLSCLQQQQRTQQASSGVKWMWEQQQRRSKDLVSGLRQDSVTSVKDSASVMSDSAPPSATPSTANLHIYHVNYPFHHYPQQMQQEAFVQDWKCLRPVTASSSSPFLSRADTSSAQTTPQSLAACNWEAIGPLNSSTSAVGTQAAAAGGMPTAAGKGLPQSHLGSVNAAATSSSSSSSSSRNGSPSSSQTLVAPAGVLDAPLPLYGRSDHQQQSAQPLTAREQAALVLRAGYLLLCFLPFFTVGLLLLLASLWCTKPPRKLVKRHVKFGGVVADESPQSAAQAGAQETPGRIVDVPSSFSAAALGSPELTWSSRTAVAAPVGRSTSNTLRRRNDRSPLKQPAGVLRVASVIDDMQEGWLTHQEHQQLQRWQRLAVRLRTSAWQLLLGGCRKSGAAFIKWGQWAATRADLFPEDFCDIMSNLHDQAPTHTFQQSKDAVERAFGMPLSQMFLLFEEQALASGSIAQVHKAKMMENGNVIDVVVKVAHPHVALRIYQDFQILQKLANVASRYRSLKFLNLKETVSMFSHTMTAQADLRVEAAHLMRFYNNFKMVQSQVTTPRLVGGLVSRDVIVETFEAGKSVAHFVKRATPINCQIVSLGVDTYLSMLLKHNFVHTDLHPGNIMVRMLDQQGNVVPVDNQLTTPPPQAPQHTTTAAATITSSTGGSTPTLALQQHRRHSLQHQLQQQQGLQAQLVLLDFGLAEELTPRVRHHFVSFLNHISSGDGRRAAWHLLRWAEHQECPDPEALTHDMVALFQQECNIHSPEGIDLDRVMKSVLKIARKNDVTIDSAYASLVIAVCVLVGFATSLDPGVNLMDAATPCFLMYNLTGRIMGRLYS